MSTENNQTEISDDRIREEYNKLNDKFNKIKRLLLENREKALKILLTDDPIIISQPGIAQQIAMSVRGTNNLLHLLDDDYEFDIKSVPGYIG